MVVSLVSVCLYVRVLLIVWIQQAGQLPNLNEEEGFDKDTI